MEWLEPYIGDAGSMPPEVKLAAVFIVVSLALTLIAYLSIVRGRYRHQLRERRQRRLHPLIDGLIIEHIVSNGDLEQYMATQHTAVAAHFRQPELRPRWARQLLIDRIVEFRNNIRGKVGNALRTLYLDLELDRDTQRKLRARSWSKKIQGLHEFMHMDVSIADVALLPLTTSSNRELRSAARHAYIKLSRNDPFKFFDLITDDLSEWDQIELFRIITTTEGLVIPSFAQWIAYSPNRSVVLFCLRLVVHFNQTGAIPTIIKLLQTPDHHLRTAAITTLGKLEVNAVETDLVQMYENQPLNCRVAILKALGRLKARGQVEFVKNEFLYAGDFEVRKNAARTLVNMFLYDSPLIQNLLATTSEEHQKLLKHSMNPLIKR